MSDTLSRTTSAAHRLAPLTTAVIGTVAGIVRAAHDLGAGMRLGTIVPEERLDDSPGRRAFVAVHAAADGNLFEAVVALDCE